MSEPVSRQRITRSDATIADFTMLVRPPGRPGAIRVFTDAQRDEAEAYAAENDAVIDQLPLSSPQ